jgi:hypothetical protein
MCDTLVAHGRPAAPRRRQCTGSQDESDTSSWEMIEIWAQVAELPDEISRQERAPSSVVFRDAYGSDIDSV